MNVGQITSFNKMHLNRRAQRMQQRPFIIIVDVILGIECAKSHTIILQQQQTTEEVIKCWSTL